MAALGQQHVYPNLGRRPWEDPGCVCSSFKSIYTCRGSVVLPAMLKHADILFPISNSNSAHVLGEPHLSPPSLSLFFLSLFLLWLTSFTPSHLSISSHLALKSLFQFQNALKPVPARRSPALPRDKTLGLFTSFLCCTLLEGKVPQEGFY